MRSALLMLLVCLAVPGAADTVSVASADIDGDGEAERVLENRYLRVVVHVPQARGVEKYGTRFTWGGWIDQITFRPDGTDYLWVPPEGRSPAMGFGLPEEFERPLFVDADETGERWIKPGVGLIRRPKTSPAKAELIEAPPWIVEEVDLPQGRRGLRFAHTVGPVAGVGYHYEKEIALEPDSAVLRLRMAFQNTGTKPLQTEWYSHAFCAPGGYGPDCWQEIPYRLGTGESARVDRDSHAIPDLPLATSHAVWGWLTPPEIAGRWHAVGNYRTGHFLAGVVSEDPIRIRVWLSSRTYSPEPFLAVDLAPGKVKHWDALYLCGRGLDAISDLGSGGALRIESAPEGVRPGERGQMQVRFAPARPHREVAWTAEAVGPDGKRAGRWRGTFRDVRPDRPGKAVLPWTPSPGRTHVRVVAQLPSRKGPLLAVAEESFDTEEPAPTARRRHQAHGDRALILSGADAGKAPSYDVVYLESYLRWAGFRPEVAGPEKLTAEGLSSYRCVLVPGTGLQPPQAPPMLGGMGGLQPLTDAQGAALTAYVQQGGGLVHTAPLTLASGPAAEALPIEATAGQVESARWRFFYGPGGFPQEGGMPEVGPERIHLRRAAAHPLTDDLALFPDALQSIARIEKVRPRASAQVPLLFTRDAAPALLLGRHGRGRVALFAAPVAWGEPACWVIWGRFAEYHRKLFAEMALWAAGLVPDPKAPAAQQE